MPEPSGARFLDGTTSDHVAALQPPVGDRLNQGLMITCSAGGVSLGEGGDRLIEHIRFAEISADHRRVAGSRVPPGQRPGAQGGVFLQAALIHRGQVRAPLAVPQRADVIVTTAAWRLAPCLLYTSDAADDLLC